MEESTLPWPFFAFHSFMKEIIDGLELNEERERINIFKT